MFTNNQLRLIHKLVTDQIKLVPLYFRDGHKDYQDLITVQELTDAYLKVTSWWNGEK